MRRAVLTAAGGLVLVAAIAVAWNARPVELSFEPMDDPEGFRRLGGSALTVTPSMAAFAGLDDGVVLPEADLSALHLAEGPGVPVAVFGDFACTVCGPYEERLAALADEDRIALTRHPLARLTAASGTGALAAAAAELQGEAGALDRRLYRSRFLPTDAWLSEVAAEEGLDGARLLADMRGGAAAARVGMSESLARRFGVVGTPVTVIGRTVVIGAPSERELTALIEAEREAM